MPPEKAKNETNTNDGISIHIMKGNSDITDKTTTVYIGEKIELKCKLTGTATLSNKSWDIPVDGKAITGWTNENNNGEISHLTADKLTNVDSIVFYWVKPVQSQEVKFSCTAKYTKDGTEKTVNLVAKTTFKIKAPTIGSYLRAFDGNQTDIGNPQIINFATTKQGGIQAGPDILTAFQIGYRPTTVKEGTVSVPNARLHWIETIKGYRKRKTYAGVWKFHGPKNS